MAEKRMIAKRIIDSDAFLDMPLSAQALYLHLNVRADDEGFVDNPKKIMRIVGANQNDLEILLAKRYLLSFDSGVVVIKHWKLHNWIRKDRIKPTVYQEERALLTEKENGSYTDHALTDNRQTNGSQLPGKCTHSIDKISIDKGRGEEDDTPPVKQKYQDHVYLTDDEKDRLDKMYGKTAVSNLILSLDTYLDSHPAKRKGQNRYRSHYKVIRVWGAKDGLTPRDVGQKNEYKTVDEEREAIEQELEKYRGAQK